MPDFAGDRRPEAVRGRKDREGELLREHLIEWKNELPRFDGVEWEEFERGFFRSLRADSPDHFFPNVDTLFAAAPIDTLKLHRFYSEDAKSLARLEQLRHLHKLDLEDGNSVGNPGIDALASSPYLSELRELRLRSNSIGAAGARAIGSSATFAKLVWLWLDRNDLFEGVRFLAGSDTLRSLWNLRLSMTQSGPFLRGDLFDAPVFEMIRALDFDSDGLDDESAMALAGSTRLRRLHSLYLNANRIGDIGVAALAVSPILGQLRHLYLRSNRVGDAGARALAASPYLEHVSEIFLGDNRVGPGREALRARFGSRASLG